MQITNYLKAGYPALFINTLETHRAIETIRSDGWTFRSWDCLRGIIDTQSGQPIDFVKDPLDALQWLSHQSDSILFVSNFHHFIESVEGHSKQHPHLESQWLLFDHGRTRGKSAPGNRHVFYLSRFLSAHKIRIAADANRTGGNGRRGSLPGIG